LIGEEDNLYEVLQQWDQYEEEVKFVLRPGPTGAPSHLTQQYREGQHIDGKYGIHIYIIVRSILFI